MMEGLYLFCISMAGIIFMGWILSSLSVNEYYPPEEPESKLPMDAQTEFDFGDD